MGREMDAHAHAGVEDFLQFVGLNSFHPDETRAMTEQFLDIVPGSL
jgi:hypothetical protein